MSDDIMYDSKEDCYMVSEERLAEFEKAVAERDELAAELERVKAERDELKANSFRDDLKTMSILAETDQHIKDCKTFLEEFKNLSDLKSRLPVNADGDVVVLNDKVYFWSKAIEMPHELTVKGFRIEPYKGREEVVFIITPSGRLCLSDCHSTAESCRAANEKGE